MSSFTGFNPTSAQSNIREFEDTGTIILNDLSYYNKLFMDSLSKVWFSPYAVQFGTEFTPVLYNSQALVKQLVNNTIVDCVDAYNAIAQSNGYPTIGDGRAKVGTDDYAPNGTNETYLDMLDISPDNEVGMDKEKVAGYVQEYKNYINTVQTELEQFPLSIAFYDPAGELLAAFKSQVNAIKEKLDSNFREMEAAISSRLSEEQDKVVEGAREASTRLSGGGQ